MHDFNLLLPVVVLLCSGFVIILMSRVAKISPVIGFLLVGVGLGPHGLGIIPENKTTTLLAELGVVFLLFDIGLHFSVKSIWSRRQVLLGLAPLQMIFCGLIMGGAIMIWFNGQFDAALLVGMALALSSTAVVMQILMDLRQSSSPVGQTAKSVLIFQDIGAIFLLIFADVFGSDTALAVTVLEALIKTVVAVIGVVAFGRFVLTPLMKVIIGYDDPEMFTMLGLLIVMVTGLATAQAGLSLTLGAFLAGMVMAETPFRVLLQTELRPFRSLLMAFFFITVGMIMDPVMVFQNPGPILSLLAMIVLVKASVIAVLMVGFRRRAHQIWQLSLLLAQGSEFAFVIFSMSNVQAALGLSFTQELIAAVMLSMMVAPFLSLLGNYLSLRVCNKMEDTICNCPDGEASPVRHQPVFIIGMNDVGQTLARALRSHNIPYIAVDNNRQRFLEATASGFVVAYGEPGDLRFWNALGVREARAICVAAPRYDVAKAVAPIVNRLYPTLRRYVAVNDSAEGVRYAGLGLKPFHNRGTPPGLEMACCVLRDFEVVEEKINDWIEQEQAGWLDSHATGSLEDVEKVSTAA